MDGGRGWGLMDGSFSFGVFSHILVWTQDPTTEELFYDLVQSWITRLFSLHQWHKSCFHDN